MRQIHAPLQFTKVLHARHDLLTGIAAFLEIHASDKIEIRHLRHELFLRLRQNDGDAGVDSDPVPTYATGWVCMLAEHLPERRGLLHGNADLEACITELQHTRLPVVDEAER